MLLFVLLFQKSRDWLSELRSKLIGYIFHVQQKKHKRKEKWANFLRMIDFFLFYFTLHLSSSHSVHVDVEGKSKLAMWFNVCQKTEIIEEIFSSAMINGLFVIFGIEIGVQRAVLMRAKE